MFGLIGAYCRGEADFSFLLLLVRFYMRLLTSKYECKYSHIANGMYSQEGFMQKRSQDTHGSSLN